MVSFEDDTLEAFPEALLGRQPLVRTRMAQVQDLPTSQRGPPYNMHQSYLCSQEEWIDQTGTDDLVMTTPEAGTVSRSSSYPSMVNDVTTTECTSNAFLSFDVAEWPQQALFTCETSLYSSDIYADEYSPGNNHNVDLNDIDTPFDCDISTLDSYLHSPSCSGTNLSRHQPNSSTRTQVSSSAGQSPTFDKSTVKEFFPDLCDTSSTSVLRQTCLRSNQSVDTVATTSRYSPYSRSSLSSDTLSDYREKRDKNNIASQRSRQKRAEKQREMRNEKEMLERRNIELKTLLGSLEVQVADYKQIVLMIISKFRS